MSNKKKKNSSSSSSKVDHDDDDDGDYYRYYNSDEDHDDDEDEDCSKGVSYYDETFSQSMTRSYTTNEVSSQESPIYDTTTSSQRQQQKNNKNNINKQWKKKRDVKTIHEKKTSSRREAKKGDVSSSSAASSSSSPLSSYDSDSSRSLNNNDNNKKTKEKNKENTNYIQLVPKTLRLKVSSAIQQRIQLYRIISIICGIIALGIILYIVTIVTRPISFEEPSFWNYNCSYVVTNVGLDWNYISQTSPCTNTIGTTATGQTTLCTYSSHTIYMYCPSVVSTSSSSFGLGSFYNRNRNGQYYTYRAQYGDSYGIWERYDKNDGVLPAIWEDSDDCDELYGMMDGWYSACQDIGYFNDDDDDDDDDNDYYRENKNNNNNNNDATSSTTRATCIRNQYDGIVSCDGTKEDLQLDSDGNFYPM